MSGKTGGKGTDGLLKSSSSVTLPNISHAKPAKKNRKLFSNILNVSKCVSEAEPTKRKKETISADDGCINKRGRV